MSAAVSPLIRLRFAVSTKPAWENNHPETVDEAWTARYLRASLTMGGYRVSLWYHQPKGPPMPSTP